MGKSTCMLKSHGKQVVLNMCPENYLTCPNTPTPVTIPISPSIHMVPSPFLRSV